MKIYLLAIALCSVSFAFSQSTSIVNRDPQIELMVKEVSQDSLQANIKKLVSFGTRNTLSATSDPDRGIGAAREWILERFKSFAKESGGRLSAKLDTSTYQSDGRRIDVTTVLTNVVATLKGTDPTDKRVFVISAHMDSRASDVMDRVGDAPGANDDGSGTAAVIECARVMSKHSFPATIIFVALCGEEQGLLGANFMARNAKAVNMEIAAVLNNDMIGNNNSNETNIIDNTKVRIFSEGLPAVGMDEKKAASIRALGLENDGPSRQLARYMKEIGERYIDNLEVVLVNRPDRFLRGGDQTPFQQQGFTAVRVTEMNENYIHQHQDIRIENGLQYGDLEEFMDFEYLRKNTAMNVSNLGNLAKSAPEPKDVSLLVSDLSNSTTLFWKAAPSANLGGYYVLMRETTSPIWQKKFFTKELLVTLPYSKDNYFFAVQSVSKDGNEGLPIIPTVSRRLPE